MFAFLPNGIGTCTVYFDRRCNESNVIIPEYSPDGDLVNSIGDSAFSNCTSLESITIPTSVKKIGWNAFSNCLSLTNITIPDGVTSIYGNTFRNCASLVNITIPSSVTSIGAWAFRDCKHLENISLPDNVTSIGERAFGGCTSLKNISIPNSVTNIGTSAFHNCTSLFKKMYVKATNATMECLDYQFSLGEWNHEDYAIMCKKGFHFVTNPFDIFDYYCGEIGKVVRFFEVEVDGVSDERDSSSKRVCTDIKLKREITSYHELLN